MHPYNDEAWKHFNSVHLYFLAESRNMHFGLCTDGFNPFGLFAAPYSCWLVILMVYSLFLLEHECKTSMSILHGKQQSIHANKRR
jgi:hypothetical protein